MIVLHGWMDCHQTDMDRYAADVGSVGEFWLTLYQTGGNEQQQ